MVSNIHVKEYYAKEKLKLIETIKKFDKIANDNNIEYIIIKLQELNLGINETLDKVKKNNISDYVKGEYDRRDKINDLLPIFTYLYMNYNK